MTRPTADLTQGQAQAIFLLLGEILLVEALMELLEGTEVVEPVCGIGRTIKELPEPYSTALRGLISNPWAEGGLSADEVAAVMLEAGLKSSPSAVTRHRRNTCGCRTKGKV